MDSKKLLRRLDLTTLQLFVAVFEEGTLTRASRREAIAVSAASKRLLELEQALGTAVFVRQATGMSLTPAGETLLHHARRVLVDVERIGLDLADYAAGVRGHVRMVANLSAIVEYLPEDLREFQEAYDNIQLDLEERPSSGVVRAVSDNIADLGICAGDIEMRGLQCAHYRHDRLVMVVRADHPFAGCSRIGFADTLDCDHVGMHSASFISTHAHSAAAQAGRPLRLRIRVPSFDAVCRMVQAGMGVGMLPHKVFESLGRPHRLVAVELTDEWARRRLKIVVRDVDRLPPVSRLLFNHLSMVEADQPSRTS
jgi:DNA-binding transcriptional LysR family regulator